MIMKKKMRSWQSYNRRASAMKTLIEMMDGATPEQCEALAIAVRCVGKREMDKMKNRARRMAAAEKGE